MVLETHGNQLHRVAPSRFFFIENSFSRRTAFVKAAKPSGALNIEKYCSLLLSFLQVQRYKKILICASFLDIFFA
jgi:hypothetical protein